MLTRSHIRINTALLIFLVFLFRMLFVNVCLFTSLNSGDGRSNSHFSNLLKKRRRADVQNKAAFEMASAEVMCEESSGGEEDNSKMHSPAVLTWFHSAVKEVSEAIIGYTPFASIKCDLYPRRYLTLSVLRI